MQGETEHFKLRRKFVYLYNYKFSSATLFLGGNQLNFSSPKFFVKVHICSNFSYLNSFLGLYVCFVKWLLHSCKWSCHKEKTRSQRLGKIWFNVLQQFIHVFTNNHFSILQWRFEESVWISRMVQFLLCHWIFAKLCFWICTYVFNCAMYSV